MADVSQLQVATQKLQPLVNLVAGQGGQVPLPGGPAMGGDASHAPAASPSYFRSLEAILHTTIAQGDSLVRGASGGYQAPGNPNRASRRDAETDAPTAGLGLFVPQKYMRGRDRDPGDQDGRQDPREQQSRSSIMTAQVAQLAQLAQAQQLARAQRSPLDGLSAPLRRDGVDFAGMTPKERSNTFNELMLELVDRLASELNELASASSAPSRNSGDLLSGVPQSLFAQTPGAHEALGRLENALAHKLLQESRDVSQAQQTAGVLEAAELVVRTAVEKMQRGEISPSPEVMSRIAEALEVMVELNPSLMHGGVGQRLTQIRSILAVMRGQNAAPAADANEGGEAAAGAWRPQAEEDGVERPVLARSRAFDHLDQTGLSSDGVLSGVGSEEGRSEEFAYRLEPDGNGRARIMGPRDAGDEGFSATATFADDGDAPRVAQGEVRWNGGRDGIRLSDDGGAEVTNDHGREWMRLPPGDSSQYTSPNGRFVANFSPLARRVQFMEFTLDGRQIGAVDMHVDGRGVGFPQLLSRMPTAIGPEAAPVAA